MNVRISIFLFSNTQRKCNFPPHIRVIYMLMRWDKFDATKMKFGLHLPQLTHESKICCCTFSSKPSYRIYLGIIWTFNLHPDVRSWDFFLTIEKCQVLQTLIFLRLSSFTLKNFRFWKIQYFSKTFWKVITEVTTLLSTWTCTSGLWYHK